MPDFASDPVVASYGATAFGRGWLQLLTREPAKGIVFLRSKDQGSGWIGVPIATAYPGELQLQVVR